MRRPRTLEESRPRPGIDCANTRRGNAKSDATKVLQRTRNGTKIGTATVVTIAAVVGTVIAVTDDQRDAATVFVPLKHRIEMNRVPDVSLPVPGTTTIMTTDAAVPGDLPGMRQRHEGIPMVVDGAKEVTNRGGKLYSYFYLVINLSFNLIFQFSFSRQWC